MNDERSRHPGLEFTLEDERLLDRLVDGSLDLPAQRDLVTRLDQIPQGWRHCALAFLEAQAWRSELRQFRGDAVHFENTTVPQAEESRITNRQALSGRALARIVGVALALSVAFGLGRLSIPTSPRLQDEIVRAPEQGGASGRAEENVAENDRPLVTPQRTRELEAGDDVRVAARLSWQLQGGEEGKVEVPVLEGRGLDMEWVMQQPTAVQASIRKELERRGHRVETQRQLLTVNLKDGRSVVVPIDQVHVKFAERVFQ